MFHTNCFSLRPNSGNRAGITIGWVLLVSMSVIFVLAAIRMVDIVMEHRKEGVRGDGENIETYGFDLSNLLVPKDEVIAGGMAKNSLLALSDPEKWTPAEVDQYNEDVRGKYLVSSDKVAGVEINGETCAYPLRVLIWHEVINDTLGGVPIAVTYNYLCDSVVVFDRRVGEEVLEFGFSGLLYKSNSLFYDERPEDEEESLWSQMGARAVAGPAAEQEQTLEVIPSQRVTWAFWKGIQPETKVIEPDLDMMKQYQSNPGGGYFGSDLLLYPVEPLPPEDSSPARKDPVLVLQHEGQTKVFPVQQIIDQADEEGNWEGTFAGEAMTLRAIEDPACIYIEGLQPEWKVYHSLWFAWYAFHPQATIASLQ